MQVPTWPVLLHGLAEGYGRLGRNSVPRWIYLSVDERFSKHFVMNHGTAMIRRQN